MNGPLARAPVEPPAPRPEQPDPLDDATVGRERLLRCAACGTAVAEARSMFSPDGGAPRRVFANPAGRVFEIVCVRATSATRAVGVPTHEHTWFPGHEWRVLLCGICGSHLGWAFGTGSQVAFCALITEKISEDGG